VISSSPSRETSARLAAAGYPVVAGLSRKRMIGEITGRPVEDRVARQRCRRPCWRFKMAQASCACTT